MVPKGGGPGASAGAVRLGIAYSEGRGVAKDDVEAYKWMLVAGEMDEGAGNVRAAIGDKLSPAQMALAQRWAVKWKPKPEGSAQADKY